ncbi:MAG: hypothetical protein MZW92_05335 [Comamonadaceae bacterium]|nr:hypothetical protein [Comamonadaceae bacterium]
MKAASKRPRVIRIDWKQSRFLRRSQAARPGTGARLRHLPRLPALRQPVQRRSRRCSISSTKARRGEVDGVPKEKYWDVVDQCYLCDMCYMTQVPLRAAAPVEPRLPAPDAAGQGGEVPEGQGAASATSS